MQFEIIDPLEIKIKLTLVVRSVEGNIRQLTSPSEAF